MCIAEALHADAGSPNGFADRIVDVLNGAALALMTSIGHRTNLFDTMSALQPSSSASIAEAAGLEERYVREWLGAMVTGRIVDFDAGAGTYSLPPEHAAFLTRAAGADNLASLTQYVAMLGGVEDRIVACFMHGGGVPYSEFGRFQEIMAEDSSQGVLPALIDQILPLAPGIVERLHRGIDVLDVGCGRGLAMIELARRFPNSRFVGYDISKEGIETGRAAAERLRLPNIRLEIQDAASFHDTDCFDLITTFDAVHDQADPAALLRNIHRALREDGTYLMQDICGSSHVENNMEHPIAPLLYTISCMHCMTVSLAAGGAGLGAMWGREKAQEMLATAGFTSVAIENLPHDIQNHYYIVRK